MWEDGGKRAPETGSRSHDLVLQKFVTNNHSAMLCLVTQSCPTLCDIMNCSPLGSSVHGDSPDKNNGVGCHALLQGIFLTQGSNPGLSHCRQISYRLSHQRSHILNQKLSGSKLAPVTHWVHVFPGGANGKESAPNAGDIREASSMPGSGRFPWRREWQPTPVFSPGESHGQRGLVGYSP